MKREERANNYLAQANAEATKTGQLKIFFGYAAGVGKTYAMLAEAQDLKEEGKDVVIGCIEDHGRQETRALTKGLEAIPPKKETYKGMTIAAFDLTKALARHPQVLLVDELAHTNVPGSRHMKRYQDVQELLNAGINVYTTLNVQHLESLQDVVAAHLNLTVRERVPDYVFDMADQVKLVDIEPKDLLQRLKAGKIYAKKRIDQALSHFFQTDHLIILRELALRKMTLRIATSTDKTAERLLVCLSGSASNPRVIRSAAQMAQAFNSDFIAVYVKKDALDDQHSQLNANIELAHRLGAKIIKLQGENPAIQIAEYAKESSVTKIVLGASPRQRLWRPKVDLVTQLGQLLPEVDEYVINGQVSSPAQSFRMTVRRFLTTAPNHGVLHEMTIVLGILLGSTLVGKLLNFAHVPVTNIVLVYMLGVMLCAISVQSQLYGVLSAVLAVLSFNFFFTQPYFSLASSPIYLLTFLLMLLVLIISNSWTLKIKKQARYNAQRVYQTEVLLETIRKLQSATQIKEIIETTSHQLQKIYPVPMIFYEAQGRSLDQPRLFPAGDTKIPDEILSEDERAVAVWTLKNGQEAGATTATLPRSKGFYLPVFGDSPITVIAVVGFVINKKQPLDVFDRNLLISVLDECGQALTRMRILEKKRKTELQVRQEKLRSNLLRGISHDLRTPLTNISGSADILRQQGKTLTAVEKQTLYESIFNDASWLTNLVENLLSMTRLENSPKVKHDPELVDDIITESLNHLSPGANQHPIKVDLSDQMLMIRADARLITQVIINIVNNAIQHTPPQTKIWLHVFQKNQNQIQFEIANDGPRLDRFEAAHLFNLFYTGKNEHTGQAQRGLGIGLSLCKSIIETYGGKIWAKNLPDQGVCFYFTLPAWSIQNHE